MIAIIVTLLVVWLIITVLGFVIEGFFWLAVLGLILFVATLVWGWIKRKTRA